MMEQTLAQQQQSFEKKIAKIRRANNDLNELQKKMNMHFEANKETLQNREKSFSENYLDDFQKIRSTEKRQQWKQPRFTNITHKPFITQNNFDNKAHMNIERSQKKISNIMHTENIPKIDKKKQSFKLFTKAKSQQPKETTPAINMNQPQCNFQKFQMPKRTYPKYHNITQNQMNIYQQQNNKNSHKNFLQQLESMEQLMKQKLNSKQSKLRQLEQQLLNQNQERIYLYKVNVRLEEQYKLLLDDKRVKQKNESPILSYKITQLEKNITKLKQEIKKRKKQKKQLLKEEQTLKQGYKTVLQNCKLISSKQIHQQPPAFSQCDQKKTDQNQKVLKKLMGDLQKLRNLVQDRIKETSQNKTVKRRVIKSYKA